VLPGHCAVCAGVCFVDGYRQQENYAVDTQKTVLFITDSKKTMTLHPNPK